MADLADKIDDLICTFDGTLNATADMIAMYSFGVFVFVFLVFVLVCHLWSKYRKPKPSGQKLQNSVDAKLQPDTQKSVASLGSTKAGVPATPPVRKRLGSKSGKIANIAPVKPKSLILPPPATGSDTEAVKWVNDLFFWLYSDQVVVNELVNLWIQSLNEAMKPSVAEVS
ncbi:hypothetical protein V9T40_001016 [Parthenolecanium corni]|uniref:Uncharacterized protein n=1 Tax=Parthenolecanium corni TaxID=536013 RepID=A0AAN9TNH2_9HEMI